MGFKSHAGIAFNKKEEITGIFQSVTYAKNGFFIGKIFANNAILTIKGSAEPDDFLIGVEYRFSGTMKDDPKFGRQFCFDCYAIPEPVSVESIMRYLRQFDGIGESRSRAIVNRYGENAINQIRRQPETVADNVGIKPEILINAANKLDGMTEQEQVRLELMSLLDGKGFPKTTINNLIKDYSGRAANAISANPFVMTRYPGIGFELCDQVWKSMKLPLNHVERKKAYVLYLMQSDSTGSTWFAKEDLFNKYIDKFNEGSSESHNVLRADFQNVLDELSLIDIREYIGKDYIALSKDASVENSIIENLQRLQYSESSLEIVLPQGELTDSQYQAAKRVLYSPVGILAGCPGTGKTFTAAAIIKAAVTSRIAVAAPTGKAALRIQESMKRCGVEIEARTIHSLLEASWFDGKFQFTRNRDNPIDVDFVVVDESSMIDNNLMNSLLSACWTGTRILFVGDTQQLPPVGKGAPLRDFIALGVPCGRLTEIQRNSGLIVAACALIREGETFPFLSFPPDEQNNLVYTYNNPNGENLVKLLNKIGGKDCVNTQIIVPLNERGDCSRAALNKLLQEYYNPNSPVTDRRWKQGDKVICLTNGSTQNEFGEETRISNGDIGFVSLVNNRDTWVKINGVDIVVPRYSEKWSESDWDLGYAITCHKSQGSEWDSVIVMLDSAGRLSICDRHWIYTAISRAKQFCYLMGRKETAQRMIARTTLLKRITGFSLNTERLTTAKDRENLTKTINKGE